MGFLEKMGQAIREHVLEPAVEAAGVFVEPVILIFHKPEPPPPPRPPTPPEGRDWRRERDADDDQGSRRKAA